MACKPAPPAPQEEAAELAPVQLLPDELALLILSRVDPYALGRLACVCRSMRLLTEVRAHGECALEWEERGKVRGSAACAAPCA